MDYWLIAQAVFVTSLFVALIGYVVIGKRRQRNAPKTYNWKPEQDYDVIMRGETPMTPGFPVLKKRKKSKPTKQEK